MPQLFLKATHEKHMPWGDHPVAVTKHRKGGVINVSERLFDALLVAEITGPEGRGDRISMAQYRKLVAWLPDDQVVGIKVSLTGAFIAPVGME
jgi:hypothetical protein